MRARRYIALALMAVQAITLWYMYGRAGFPLALGAFALVGVLFNAKPAMTWQRKLVFSLAVAAVYAAKWRVAPTDAGYLGEAIIFGDPDFAYAFAQYFLTLQALQLWLRENAPSRATPLFGAVVMAAAGDMIPGARAAGYQVLALAFAALVAAYFVSCRPSEGAKDGQRPVGKWIALAMLLCLALGAASVTSVLMYRNRNEIDVFFLKKLRFEDLVRSDAVGFSGSAYLGSLADIKSTRQSKVALRVSAPRQPGYLRGRAFTIYNGPNWRIDGDKTSLNPSPHGDIGDLERGDSLFTLREADPADCEEINVQPEADFGRVLFTPLDTAFVAAPATVLSVDENAIVETPRLAARGDYTALVSPVTGQAVVPEAALARLVSVPEDMDPGLLRLAETLCEGRTTTLEKIAAVTGYFHGNYEYRLGIDIPPGEDPLTYFLLEQPPAHCEFFASGAAILLRLAGVPCRYVTGFVAAERNPYGEYWIARNKHAHAWVEAYDAQERTWLTVEATPADGVPAESESGRLAHLWDYAKHRLGEIVNMIRERGLGGVAPAVQALVAFLLRILFMTGPGRLVVGCLAILGVVCIARRIRKRKRPRLDPRNAALHRLLREVDRRVAKDGLLRHEHETLDAFSRRVAKGDAAVDSDSAAAWYLDYARVRYGRSAEDARACEELEARMPEATSR